MEELYNQISRIGRVHHADKIVLFGSRARGDNRERSDIDLAVYGMPEDERGAFWSAIDDLPTLLDFDIVHISGQTAPELLENIEKDGVILMDKKLDKYQKLTDAVERLKEALDDYSRLEIDSVRDGAIQRFEFCTELAWKTVREYLLDQGYTEINSPKSVMKQAYADGIVNNEDSWIDLLSDRNLTSHIYDQLTAARVFDNIEKVYYPMFCSLINTLAEK